MTPILFEALLFLRANKELWDEHTLKQAVGVVSMDQRNECLHKKNNDADQEDVEEVEEEEDDNIGGGDNQTQLAQKVVGELGAARYGAKYSGPDKSFEHSAEIQKLVKDNPEAKAIGLELLRPNLTEEKKEELRQRLRTIADTIAGDIERRKQSPGAAPSTNAPAAVPGAPRPGTVKDGYRFKGGDPSNPTSWEKV